MESNGETKGLQQQPAPTLAQPSTTTDLYLMCRLCLSTLNADEGESVFNNQVPSLPEKIYRVFGVSSSMASRGFWRAPPIVVRCNRANGDNSPSICLWRRRVFFCLLTGVKILLTDNSVRGIVTKT